MHVGSRRHEAVTDGLGSSHVFLQDVMHADACMLGILLLES
jgi:hypothetical protein